MGRGDRRRVRLAEDPFEIAGQRLARRRIERGEGFVEENDLRFRDEGPGEAGPLRLAAGELPGGALRQVADAEAFQVFGNRPLDLRPPHAADLEPRGDILEDGRIEQERLLEDHRDVAAVVEPAVSDPLPPEEEPSPRRLQQTGKRQQQRRFSRAVRADQGEDLPLKTRQGRGCRGPSPRPGEPGDPRPAAESSDRSAGFIGASPAAGSG